MSFGFAIRQQNGRLWCSPDVTPMVFHEKIVLQPGVYPTLLTTVPANQPIMIFYTGYPSARVAGAGGVLLIKDNSKKIYHSYNLVTSYWQRYLDPNWYQDSDITGKVEFYIFTTAYSMKKSTHGLNVFNSEGRLTYSADMIPLQLKYKSRASMAKTYSLDRYAYHDFGVRIAVVPGLVYDLSAKSGASGNGYHYEIHKYISATNGGSVYGEWMIQYYEQKNPAPRVWYGLKNIFYIETEIYDRYLTLKK